MGREDISTAAVKDFIWGDDQEPHAPRKGAILKAHPEIYDLMGPEWRTKYLVAATVLLQIFMAWLTLDWSWTAYLCAIYVIGATANHSLFLAIHEMSHFLGSKKPHISKLIGMVGNLPIGIPYSITFRPYHMEHHRYQGHDQIDTDIPSYLEGWFISSTATCYIDHTMRKAVFMFFQIFAYAFRPMCIKPDLVPADKWLIMNWAAQITFDCLMMLWLGPRVMLYFLLCTFFAGSIHPTAGHFLAEHYCVDGKTETYSYYGPLNVLTYNVGYHNEHHDFPNIAWSNLPKVRQLAPEFYDNLPQCESWPGIILKYIFDNSITPFSRVKRHAHAKKA